MTTLKEERDTFMTVVRVMIETDRKKSVKIQKKLNTNNQLDLIDIYRAFHPTTTKKEYILFNSV